MTQFWLLAVLMIIVATCFVLLPLLFHRTSIAPAESSESLNISLHKERLEALQAEFEANELDEKAYLELKLETERALLADASQAPVVERKARGGWLLIAGALLLIPLTLGLYSHWGAADLLAQSQTVQKTPQTRAQMVAWLEAREASMGDQPDGEQLYNLARSYQSVAEYDQAERVYLRLIDQEGAHAELFAQLAQLRFMATNNPVDASMGRFLQQALALDANNLTALGLAGVQSFELSEYAQAAEYWRRALALEPAGEGAQALEVGIARAEQALTEQRGGAVASEVPDRTIELKLLPPENTRLPASARVFVFARASTGPAMPLAVTVFSAAELPKTVSLTSQMAMTEGMGLSDFEEVDLVARVSLSGDVKQADYQAAYTGYKNTDTESISLQLIAVPR